MAKAQKKTTTSKRRRTTRPVLDPLLPAEPTAETTRLALKLDSLMGDSVSLNGKRFGALRDQIMGDTIRGGHFQPGQLIPMVRRGRTWPDTLYVPKDQASFGSPKPPADHLYSHEWTDSGPSKGDATTGAVFAFGNTPTTQATGRGDAGIGITVTPPASLCVVRFEPEVNCAVTYRAKADFWPDQIMGKVRARGWLVAAAWERTGGSFAMVNQNVIPVFDTGSQNAFDGIFPTTTMLQRNFSGSALATTFLLLGGRTYLLGIVAVASVDHSVTTNGGKVLPQDATKFLLYSQLVCSVPYMSAYTQVVFP